MLTSEKADSNWEKLLQEDIPGVDKAIASILTRNRTLIKDEEGSLDGELLRELGNNFEAINPLLKVLAEAAQRTTAAEAVDEGAMDQSCIATDPLASLTFSEAREMQLLDSHLLPMLEVLGGHPVQGTHEQIEARPPRLPGDGRSRLSPSTSEEGPSQNGSQVEEAPRRSQSNQTAQT